jgi:hypothetical protein
MAFSTASFERRSRTSLRFAAFRRPVWQRGFQMTVHRCTGRSLPKNRVFQQADSIAGMPTCGVPGQLLQTNDKFAHGLSERVPVCGFYSALEHWHILLMELAGR